VPCDIRVPLIIIQMNRGCDYYIIQGVTGLFDYNGAGGMPHHVLNNDKIYVFIIDYLPVKTLISKK